MKEVDVRDAVGTVLAHDLTQIIPGEFKGSKFKKGHVVREEDIETLLSMGKRHLYVLEKSDTDVHEDEAARRIAAAVTGEGILAEAKGEGKVELAADRFGLLKIDVRKLFEIVEDDTVVLATIHQNQVVCPGDRLAGTRVIPLFVREQTVAAVEAVCKDGPVLSVVPLKDEKVGVVTTGSEVYSGRIQDRFGPVLIEKFRRLGSTVMKQLFADDDEEMIAEQIRQLIREGAGLICVTGGMSVDPDDRTPLGIRKAGGEIVTYGASVLPGAMFLLAYIGEVPVVGLPGCVMYSRTSIFDLIIPRLLAGERPSKAEMKRLAHGGLCLNCPECTFPVCGFGKASIF